jgi:hypothetical protein
MSSHYSEVAYEFFRAFGDSESLKARSSYRFALCCDA